MFVQDLPLGLPVADPSAALGDLHTSKNVLSNKGYETTIAARPKPMADKKSSVTIAGLSCAQVLSCAQDLSRAQVLTCAQDVPRPSCSESCLSSMRP